MKAVLRNRHGFTRDYAISPPPPPIIKMAVSEQFPSQIWDPTDLMTGEKAIFKEVVFRKFKPCAEDDSWLYVEDEGPSLAAINKVVKDKMAAGFVAGVMAKSPFFEQMKKLQIPKQEQYKLDDATLDKIVKEHRAKHQYGHEIESMMTQLGFKNPPHTGEPILGYLDRLLDLANQGAKPMDWQSSTTYASNVTSDPNWKQQQEAYAEKMKEYEQQKYPQEQQWQYQQQYSNQTNMPIWKVRDYGLQKGQSVPYHLPQFTQIQSAPQAIPDDPVVEPEKPKRDLPDPIEPKKRLMKKL